MSALGGIVQLKNIAIEERLVWRLHWSAFSSQKDCIWQLTRFGGRKWRSGLNRISHPDWVKLSVELNCVPNQNTKFFPSLQIYLLTNIVINPVLFTKLWIQKYTSLPLSIYHSYLVARNQRKTEIKSQYQITTRYDERLQVTTKFYS